MIPKELKASPIFGEFSPEDQNRYFDYSREKVCAHVDTLYYTVSIFNDSNELQDLEPLLTQLSFYKQQVFLFPDREYEFFGLYFTKKKFVHYEYCLSLNEQFDIFISSFLPNVNTPRIVVQLRSRFLVQVGAAQAICRSFRYVERLLLAFNLEVDEVKENRFDYAFHTNLVQNPYKHFNDKYLLNHLKSKLRLYQKVGEIGHKVDIDYVSFGSRNSNNLFVRIYNKSREVIEKNYKSFFIDKWLKDKLINEYDHYVYTRAYELNSYVTGILVGRIEWYLEHGHNDQIKKELLEVKESCYVSSDNVDHLRKKVDQYLPPVTLIMNVEFQTKREFYHSMDNYINSFGTTFKIGNSVYFYDNRYLPLYRLHNILKLRSEICNYLTSTALCFVDGKGTKGEHFCYWWKRINQCYIEEYDQRIVDLWRDHELHADIEKAKRRMCSSIASMSIMKNNGYSNSTFTEDVSDALCTFNDNDFYGFAANPTTGIVPEIQPSYYRDLKVRKERQYRQLTKEIEKKKKEKE